MMEFPPFRLDAANQCLWRRSHDGANERLRLTPKAFAVLRYLVEHAERLVTEDELLKAVWPKVHVQPEAIKSQIYEIRKILEDDPKTPRYIETLPRRGYRFIASVRAASSVDPAAAAKPTHGRLVGRERTLLELGDCLRAAWSNQRQIVFVTGEPGIGKTAVVDEFQRQASVEPLLRITRGQCIEAYGGTEAYYPILEALGQLCSGSEAASIVDILAAQAPTWLVQFPALLSQRNREILRQEVLGATRERMLRELCAALETITANTPLLLVLEDLQWVDHSTVDLISALARRRVPAKLMLIATSRPLDMLPSDQPLSALKQDLLLHRLCHEIELEPLTEAQVAEYLCAEAPQGSSPEGLAELVGRHSEGNPLFMVTALDHLTQRGFISQENGSWHVMVSLEEIDVGVPETLRQMIEAQIERLSMEEQRALEVASVQGVAFSASLCATVINGDAEDHEILYDSMAHRGRIVRAAGTQLLPGGGVSARCEFVHALYREVLYRRQPPLRRSKLHRAVGERLEALYSQQLSDVSAELAYHFEQVSDWSRTVKYLRLAAEASEERYAHLEAIALLEHALVLARRLPEPQRLGHREAVAPLNEARELSYELAESERVSAEIAILEKLTSIYLLSIDLRALGTYEVLAERARHYGLIDVEMRALIEMAFLVSWVDSQRCMDILAQATARSALQADPFAQAKSRARCLWLRIWADAWNAEDAAVYRGMLSKIRQATDPVALAPHLIDYSFLLFMCSEYRESRESALEGLAVLTEGRTENPCASLAQTNASTILYLDQLFLGQWGDALREIETTNTVLIKNGNHTWAQTLRLWRAYLNVVAMDFAGALSICESAVIALGDAIPPPDRRFYLAVIGTAEVALGKYEQGLTQLSMVRREMELQKVLADWHTRLFIEQALTELRLAEGDIVQARAQAEWFLQVTLTTSERTFQALAWEANVRVAMAEADHNRAQACVAKALSTMEGFEVPLAEWRVHGTAAALAKLMQNTDLAERHSAASSATILRIANSLAPKHPLRMTFLSAAPVAAILRGGLGG
jgi:DNA-binding winged helix-turn-helix (wHTH) protein